jgi:DNA-binding transcriptional regulator/RsmH inhibitor MraZ
LKEAFVGEVKLVQDIQKFIRVYTKEVFEEEELDIKQTFSRGNRSASKYRMAYLSNARDAKVDAAGRLLIPSDFRSWSGIANKCVMIANGEEFLIMSPADYELWQKSPSKYRSEEAAELNSLRKDAYDEERTIRDLKSGVSK